ncbi:shikimate dehydrogenase [Bradyrhizobium lablabi]|uniref:shikimate dehydrogenase family protein n=1 Tax=Bradyrhizobium lablabi TaxID=722472 RepID=UPI001BAD3F62|nr:shikimate dehydrogenase [Bradyrhizobium lablabi]MBR0695482.1 shikimate dehydrogenase [Bradyrhizobium lablabi]
MKQAGIDGNTKLLAIIGDPITQVRSPEIYNPRIVKAGVNAVLQPMQIPTATFDDAIKGIMAIGNLLGVVVTYPHKERVLRYADQIGRIGQAVGAINAMRREPDGSWTGDMFDGAGLLGALASLGQTATGRRVLILGAGGAGSAITMALAAAGAAMIGVFDLDANRAAELAARVQTHFPVCCARTTEPDVTGFDLLINATPVGMAPAFALAPFRGALHAGLTVIDIVPKPETTSLLALAREKGCPTANGAAVVSGQADAVLAFFGIGSSEAPAQAKLPSLETRS